MMKANSIPFGVLPVMNTEVPPPIRLDSGDIYAVLSDGIFEAKGHDEEEFGTDRVIEILRSSREASAGELLDRIRRATDEFTEGAPQDDDRTIVIIKSV